MVRFDGDILPSSSGTGHIGIDGDNATGFDITSLTPWGHIHQLSGIFHDPLTGQSGVLRYSQQLNAFQFSLDGGITFSSILDGSGINAINGDVGPNIDFTGVNGISISNPSAGIILLDTVGASGVHSKSITVESPTSTEDISIFFTDVPITIRKMVAVVRGTTPSVTWTIRHGTDRSATGSQVVTGGTATTSQSTGSVVTTFDAPTVVANSFVWLETTAATGTNNEIHITIIYSED